MRIGVAALLALAVVAAPALAGPGPRTFKASITAAPSLPAVPSGKVSSAELAPPPGVTASTRGPMLVVPDPVLSAPRRRGAVPLPPPNPYSPFRTESCPITFD